MSSPEPLTAAFEAIDALEEAVEKLAAQRDHYARVAQHAMNEAATWHKRAYNLTEQPGDVHQ